MAESHPERLNPRLCRAVLDTFALTIINEYDQRHGAPCSRRDLRPHPYMATRYLQLQHPDRRGRTSGDGRSIWNGTLTHRGVTWDVSELRHRRDAPVPRHRALRALLQDRQPTRFVRLRNRRAQRGARRGAAVGDVPPQRHRHRARAGRDRAAGRPRHQRPRGPQPAAPVAFLRPLEASRSRARCARWPMPSARGRSRNGAWPRLRGAVARHRYLAEQAARTFARVAARFEAEYIFCWLDWDGDNILADGGIVDYGSVRQFGLYHREYRFDDVDRFSTTLPEQRRKARAIVQNFAQIRDYLIRGRKCAARLLRARPRAAPLRRRVRSREPAPAALPHGAARRDRGEADRTAPPARRALPPRARLVRARPLGARPAWPSPTDSRGMRSTPRAICCASFRFATAPPRFRSPPTELLTIAASSYASRSDRSLTPQRRRMASELQRAYLALLARGRPRRAGLARGAARARDAALRP